ncbi:MAG: ABC transporter ATP-binding protein [Burkholderiaceae bacterium]
MIATPAPLLKLVDVALVAAGRTLVEHLDLEIRPGQRWAVLGPNGAGKSTLLRVMSGARTPDGGEVRVDDVPIERYSELDLARVRALVTDRWIDPFASSVLDTVLTARYAFGDEDDAGEHVARKLLTALDCAHLMPRDVRRLSRGERQRVAIATALAQATPTVLLDEPTAHQDPRHQAWVIEHLLTLDDRALVATLHDINAAARFATHVLLMSGRGTHRAGPVEEVLHDDALSELFETRIGSVLADGERFFRVRTPA